MEKRYIIIGDGIVGSLLVYLLAQLGIKNVTIFTTKYHKASVNNQTWLQHGSLYDTSIEEQKTVAKLLAQQGPLFEELFHLQNHNRHGIMGVSSLDEANSKIDFLNKQGLDSYIINNREAEAKLSHFYAPDLIYLRVPDHPFEEGTILNICRSIGQQNGYTYRNADNILLQKTESNGNGYHVLVDGTKYIAEHVFVAAGVGTLKVIKGLDDISVPIKAYRSTLIKVPYPFGCSIEMFADKKRNVNFINVSSFNGKPTYLLGSGVRSQEIDLLNNIDNYKKINTWEVDEFIDHFKDYKNVQDILKKICKVEDMISCFKVEQCDEFGNPNYLPWYFSFDQYKGLVVGGAGKATLGLYTAKQMIAKSGIEINREQNYKHDIVLSEDIQKYHTMWYE